MKGNANMKGSTKSKERVANSITQSNRKKDMKGTGKMTKHDTDCNIWKNVIIHEFLLYSFHKKIGIFLALLQNAAHVPVNSHILAFSFSNSP